MASPAAPLPSFQGFRSLCENSPDAISVMNEQGVILYSSEPHGKLFGGRPEHLVGRKFTELVHREDRAQPLAALADVLRNPSTPIQWNGRARGGDGNHFLTANTMCNLLSDVGVQGIVLYQRNMTSHGAAEDATLQHALHLARSNARLEQFAYNVAHDLREPLRTISLHLEVLGETVRIDQDGAQVLDVMLDSVSRMVALIDDLLAYARTGQHAAPKDVDLGHAATQAIKNLAVDIAESNAKVRVGSLPVVRSNEIELVRLLQNLIGNAIKYRDGRPIEIDVTAEQRETNWEIRIQDNGIGIAADQQHRIFEPFVRLDSREVPGTGLGLALCKEIVENMGGSIWLESKPGVGSTFSFTVAEQ